MHNQGHFPEQRQAEIWLDLAECFMNLNQYDLMLDATQKCMELPGMD